MTKYVYLFKEGNANMRELLGGKGANLAEMTNLGMPVPQGFTVTTEACTRYYTDGKVIGNGRNQDSKCSTIKNIIAHFIKLSGAEILGNRDTESRAASHTEAEHQKLYTAACTDAGECLRAKCLADNRRINDVIRLLQQISDEKRKGKREHQLYRISLYHRCCHKKRLPCLICT